MNCRRGRAPVKSPFFYPYSCYCKQFVISKGIDYLGGILWSLWLLCIVFICVYGEHYDWLDGEPIRVAVVFAVVLLLLSLHRAATIRHPYINLNTFS